MQRRLIFSLAAAGGLVVLGARGAAESGSAERVIPVIARKFVFIPGEIEVKRGETVVLEFTAPEVVMGFFCAELNLRTMIIPGQPARVRWTADRAGRFDFICDVFCGDGHEYMNGHLVVT
jgi:cytochrome c oxidase subunit 2